MFFQLSTCGTRALKSTALLTFCTSVIRLGLWETNSAKYRQLLHLIFLGIISHRNVAYAYWNQLQVWQSCKEATLYCLYIVFSHPLLQTFD